MKPFLPLAFLPRCSGLFALLLTAVSVTTSVATTFTATTAAQFNDALSDVQPGDTIVISGTIANYTKFSTTRNGTSTGHITITGTGGAVLKNASSYGLEILHNYYRLSNFRIEDAAKGLVIDSANHGVVDNVHVMDIDQEGFKIRNQSQYWLFTSCSVRRTGRSGDYGEGFYVGNVPGNWVVPGVPDQSGYVTFFNCYATDTVNDAWDVKEGSHHVKIVNCTADFSGTKEPAHDAPRGSGGFFLRSDYIQVIKCRTDSLDNGDWAYRIANQDVVTGTGTVTYGSTQNEIKQSSVVGGNVALIFGEGNAGARVYTDCVPGPGGLKHANSSTISQPAPTGFTEMTWSTEGGAAYGNLNSVVGAQGDPLVVAAPIFSPAPGSYEGLQNVTITTATDGATIRYTTDGSTPTASAGTVYSGPVPIGVTTTLKAIAYKAGSTNSTVTTGLYTIGLLSDALSDGERATQNLPNSATWYASTGTALAVTSNALALAPNGTGLAYFTAAGTPRTLAVGGSMRATFSLVASGSAFPTGNDFLRVILLNSSGASSDHNNTSPASRISADGYGSTTAAFLNYAGYMAGVAINPPSAGAMKIYRRNFGGSNGITSSASYTLMGSNGGSGAYGFVPGNTYAGSLLVERTAASSVTVTLSFTGTFAGGTGGTWTYAQTDSTAPTYTFDTIAFFVSSGGGFSSLALDDIAVAVP